MSTTRDDNDADPQQDLLPPYTDADQIRYDALLRPLGLSSSYEPQARLEIFIAEHRVRAERRANDRLKSATDALRETTERTSRELREATERTSAQLAEITRASSTGLNRATWVLAIATIVLAFATIALAVVTVAGNSDSDSESVGPRPAVLQ
jgi:sirohydrochlorin ferrochelatase